LDVRELPFSVTFGVAPELTVAALCNAKDANLEATLLTASNSLDRGD
jgi:hypothetical protein